MPFVSTGHIWLLAILLVIVLIIWGPGKLPDVGSGLGRAIREFRKASNETRDEFNKATRGEEPKTPTPADTAHQPEVPVMPVPGAPSSPAPLASGTALGAPSENDPS